MMCRHCKIKKSCRPRGLCWTCYYKPGVRELHPCTSKYSPKGKQTEEDVEKTVQEQMKNLPDWWFKEPSGEPFVDRRDPPCLRKQRQRGRRVIRYKKASQR
jgi:hypothetical protein